MIQFKFTERETEYCDNWLSFYPKKDTQTPFRIQLEEYGYFDPRPQFNTNITSLLAVILPFFSLWFLPLLVFFLFYGWGSIYLRLPYDTGKGDESENPEYSISTFTNGKFVTELWLVWGNKGNHIELPWALQWVRTSTLLSDNTWWNETKGKRLDWNSKTVGSYEWLQEAKWKEVHPYTDNYDGTTINATISVEEREWRPRWFKWTNLFAKKYKDLKIDFDKELGREKGSWKGGVTGCSWKFNNNETPLECLKRMEKERRF